jgi:hypothetical protein
MPSGYESAAQQKDTRLGDQDQARRRGGRTEGLGASRDSGRGRGADREGLGPVRQRRPRRGGPPRQRREEAAPEQVEQPRTDEQGVSAEGREQPAAERPVREGGPVEGETSAERVGGSPSDEGAVVEETPAPVADAPDTTTQKQMQQDPTKLDQSGDESAEKKKKGSAKASSSKPATSRTSGGSRRTKKEDS